MKKKKLRVPFDSLRWISVLDRDGSALGMVGVCVDTPDNIKGRLADMEARLKRSEAEIKFIAKVDRRGLCVGEYDRQEQAMIETIRRGFGANSIDGLFKKYRPFDEIYGHLYLELVTQALLDGMKTCINARKRGATVTI